MKALSVRAPWWWAILHAGKDIENRDWPTKYRGTILLHASKWHGMDEVRDAMDFIADVTRETGHRVSTTALTEDGKLTHRLLQQSRGCIVGKVDIVDCVDRSDSQWFFGKFGFVLRNPVAFAEPIPFRGALSFFDVPDHLIPAPVPAAAE